MADKVIFEPVMEPYDTRIYATYLALAFNGGAVEVPPTQSPVWPLAVNLAQRLHRAGYALGAYHGSELRGRSGPMPLPEPTRLHSVPVARKATPSRSYGHATAVLNRTRAAMD